MPKDKKEKKEKVINKTIEISVSPEEFAKLQTLGQLSGTRFENRTPTWLAKDAVEALICIYESEIAEYRAQYPGEAVAAPASVQE